MTARDLFDGGTAGGPDVLVSAEMLADWFGVSEAAVHYWFREEQAPGKQAHGTYSAGTVVRWYVNRLRSARPEAPSKSTTSPARRRVLEAQAERLELENAQTREQLISIEVVTSEWLKTAAILATALQAMPARLAPRLVGITDPRAAYRVLDEEVHLIRTMMAKAVAIQGMREAAGDDRIADLLVRTAEDVDRIAQLPAPPTPPASPPPPPPVQDTADESPRRRPRRKADPDA